MDACYETKDDIADTMACTHCHYLGRGARTVPLQGLERDKPLQVGPGLCVPLPDRVQLEPRPGEHLEVRQDRVQGLWKNITIFQPIYKDEQVSVNHQHHRDINT